MPRGDGTGPMGQGRGTGRGLGGGMGLGGYCRCPQCGMKVAHARGAPCTSVKCPKCGTSMIRE